MWWILILFIFWPLALFVGLNLLIIPFQFTIRSFLNLITVPRQVYAIATNERLRANHALEHATINSIEDDYGPQQLAGLAKEDGFLIQGARDSEPVEKYARIGLQRLKRGESQLAIHDRCGTSMATANVISSVVFLLLLFQTGHFTIINVILAILAANMIGPVLGRWVQRFLTTSIQVQGIEIVGVEYEYERLDFFGVAYYRQPTDFFVRTRVIG